MKPWSLPKAAAKVHALLISSETGLSAEEIVAHLELSTGSVSAQLQLLVDAGLIDRLKILGKRKKLFRATRDPARIFTALAQLRRSAMHASMEQLGESLASIADQDDAPWLTAVSHMQALSRMMDDWLRVCSVCDPEWTVRWIQKGVSMNASFLND